MGHFISPIRFSDIVGHFYWDLIMIIDCLSLNQNFLALEFMDLSRKNDHVEEA